MSGRPAVSVIVPFHNSERYLASCIGALLAQEGVEGGYEIILVDNASTDASASIAGGYPGLVILEESSPGAYAARNTGLRAARAPLIAFTDADCVADPHWLASIAEGLRDPRCAVLVGKCRYPAEASLWLALLGWYENAKAEYVIGRCEPAHHFAYANNMAVRSSVFAELGPFEEWQRAADSELVHRLARRRPDLRFAYRPSMKVTHLEFVGGRARADRLRLYRRTNSKIDTFRELGVAERIGLMLHLLQRRHTN